MLNLSNAVLIVGLTAIMVCCVQFEIALLPLLWLPILVGYIYAFLGWGFIDTKVKNQEIEKLQLEIEKLRNDVGCAK